MAPLSLPSLVPLSLLFALSAAAFAPSSAGSSASPKRFVPNSYFIEVDASAAGLAKRGLTNPFVALNRTLAAVSGKGIRYDVRQWLIDLPDVFHGASIQVDEGVSMAELALIEGVKNVWPVQLLSVPTNPTVENDTSDDYVFSTSMNLTSLLSNAPAGSYPPASAYRGDTFYPHVQAGVSNLHNAGYLGEGVKIAVLDGGVDYTNPILGGCFGPGCHISFGYAFVDDSYTGSNAAIESPDPYSTCYAHGTHTTGIVGALANNLGFSGVAPMATLGHYRVLGCSGVGADDVIVKGMMRALQDGAQVVSISIAGGQGWIDTSPSQVVADYLASQGVHVIMAAGNERTEGAFFADGPAATYGGTAVGAVDTTWLPAYNATLSGGFAPLPYIAPAPLSNLTGTYDLYFTSTTLSATNDACTALPSTLDLSNSVVIVARGGCDFTVKYANLGKAGAKVGLIYNTAGSATIPQQNIGSSGLSGVGTLTFADGQRLLSYYLQNPDIKVTFPFGPLVPGVVNSGTGGIMAPYSNFGPTNELYMYPTIVAPGTDILSTVPGGVGIMRGTSMSTPFHAGAVALLLSARKSENLTPAQVKAFFMSTTSFVPTAVGASTYAPITLEGAGLTNPNKAIAARTIFSQSQFLLNDTQYLERTQPLTITNRNAWPVLYQLAWTNANGVATYNNGAATDSIPSRTPATSPASILRVTFDNNRSRFVTIPAGGSVTVQVTFTPPVLSAAERDRFPFYSGWVTISGTGQGIGRNRKEAYNLPFFGLAARMLDMPIFDTTNTVLGVSLPFLAQGNYVQTGPLVYSRSNPPTAIWRLGAGTRIMVLDLVAADIDFQARIPSITNPASINGRLAKRSSTTAHAFGKRANPTLFADVPTLGRVYAPDYVPARDYVLNYPGSGFTDYEIPFDGTYTDKNGASATAVTGTSYRMLLRALRITGNPELSSDYDSWLSPPFSFSD
ncbi:hypothetical protein JCM8097_004125 [Rhodosporidiobolus ruineniae]